MSWRECAVEALKALAWPATVLVIVLMVRRPLLAVVPLLRKLRYGEFEAEFGEELRELKQDADEALPPHATQGPTMRVAEERVRKLIAISPPAAIADVWREIETAARNAAERRGVPLSRTSLPAMGRDLEKAEILDPRQAAVFHRLRQIRNLAAHWADEAIDEAEALLFAELGFKLIDHLNRA